MSRDPPGVVLGPNSNRRALYTTRKSHVFLRNQHYHNVVWYSFPVTKLKPCRYHFRGAEYLGSIVNSTFRGTNTPLSCKYSGYWTFLGIKFFANLNGQSSINKNPALGEVPSNRYHDSSCHVRDGDRPKPHRDS